MKGNSKKHRVSFPGRFLLRNEKVLVYGLKNRGQLIHGIDLYSGKYGKFYIGLKYALTCAFIVPNLKLINISQQIP